MASPYFATPGQGTPSASPVVTPSLPTPEAGVEAGRAGGDEAEADVGDGGPQGAAGVQAKAKHRVNTQRLETFRAIIGTRGFTGRPGSGDRLRFLGLGGGRRRRPARATLHFLENNVVAAAGTTQQKATAPARGGGKGSDIWNRFAFRNGRAGSPQPAPDPSPSRSPALSTSTSTGSSASASTDDSGSFVSWTSSSGGSAASSISSASGAAGSGDGGDGGTGRVSAASVPSISRCRVSGLSRRRPVTPPASAPKPAAAQHRAAPPSARPDSTTHAAPERRAAQNAQAEGAPGGPGKVLGAVAVPTPRARGQGVGSPGPTTVAGASLLRSPPAAARVGAARSGPDLRRPPPLLAAALATSGEHRARARVTRKRSDLGPGFTGGAPHTVVVGLAKRRRYDNRRALGPAGASHPAGLGVADPATGAGTPLRDPRSSPVQVNTIEHSSACVDPAALSFADRWKHFHRRHPLPSAAGV